MKTKLEYESETLIPQMLEDAFTRMKEKIFRDKIEQDKILCHIENFRGDLIRWMVRVRK